MKEISKKIGYVCESGNYGKIKCIKIRQDKYGRLGNVGMVCFESREEANTTIQDLNESTRYIGKEYEPKNKA